MNYSIKLWIYNKSIELRTNIEDAVQKVANINNDIFLLTVTHSLYKGKIEENENHEKYVELTQIDKIKAVDIDSSNDILYVVRSEGSVVTYDEQLELLSEINLVEEYKCNHGHNGLTYKVKVKKIAINESAQLYVTENSQLWGSGYMPQIGINCETPQKIVFFSNRIVYDVCIGSNFAAAVVSKHKRDFYGCFEDNLCDSCNLQARISSSPEKGSCPLGVKLKKTPSIENVSIFSENGSLEGSPENRRNTLEKNIIFRNTEAAKDFLTRQICRMSTVGEEYLIEATEKSTTILRENMSNVATFVYEGVKTMGDKVATLSRHVSNSSDGVEGASVQIALKKNSKEDLLLSGSQCSSERDLSEIEVQEHVEGILNEAVDQLNREVWMWGNIKYGCLGNSDIKNDLPVIISSLSNQGVAKLSLQNHHACAITLDGRAYIWGQNNFHQVNLENFIDQISPKLFVCNMNERVCDAICGNDFTMILTNKMNVIYFGKDAHGHQTLYNRLMDDCDEESKVFHTVKPFYNMLSSAEYSLLNLGPKFDEHLSIFLVKEQGMLEEMLYVYQYVIKLLSKKICDLQNSSLYESLCKSFIDVLHFLTVNVKSLLQYRNGITILNDIAIIKYFKEFVSIFKRYVDVVQNVVSINGIVHISKVLTLSPNLYSLKLGPLREKSSNEKDISSLLLSPLERLVVYTEYFKKFSCLEVQAKWRAFIEYMDIKKKDAKRTSYFWLNDGKNVEFLMQPNRVIILDSMTDPISLQSSSRFSSHRFILFSDSFIHVNGSSHQKHQLRTIWVEIIHHESSHLIQMKFPEEILILVTPDGVMKNTWYHTVQQAIKTDLKKRELHQPPVARSGMYTFTKNGFFKDATYTGRWLNGKMHGSGKICWSDGRIYTGQFNNNLMCGYGIMDTPNVGIYEGEWKDNKQHGYGIFTYCNKDIYKGYFKDGYQHGHGLLRKGNFMANSASLYIGEWVTGKKCGYGIMDEISIGEKYLGNWVGCRREGNGLIVTSEGTYYEGNFHNDLLSGHGIMVLEDGTHYEGEFRGTGIVGGKGTLTLPSGHIIEGTLSGSMEEGLKITTGVFRKEPDLNASLPKSFGQLCTAPSQKWKALFNKCHDILGLGDMEEVINGNVTPRIWQNVAVYLAGASNFKRNKGDDSLQNSLNHLDVIPPFGRDKITSDSYNEIKTYLNRAFDSQIHPLGSLINNLTEAYVSSYSGKVHPILVNHAILEVIDITQRVYDIIRYLFPALPTCSNEIIIEENIEKIEIVNYESLLFPVILPKVYNCLCTLLSLKNEKQEKQYKKVLIEWNKLSDRSLMNVLSVEKKFFNLDQSINLSDKSCAFVEAIESLQQIISVFLPIEKLIVIRNTVEKMTPVAQELLGGSYAWNMDDLFPLFLYVVVRARIPHLGAELEFMEHFMDRNLENGELGIMFTTLKACYQQILQDKSFVQ